MPINIFFYICDNVFCIRVLGSNGCAAQAGGAGQVRVRQRGAVRGRVATGQDGRCSHAHARLPTLLSADPASFTGACLPPRRPPDRFQLSFSPFAHCFQRARVAISILCGLVSSIDLWLRKVAQQRFGDRRIISVLCGACARRRHPRLTRAGRSTGSERTSTRRARRTRACGRRTPPTAKVRAPHRRRRVGTASENPRTKVLCACRLRIVSSLPRGLYR